MYLKILNQSVELKTADASLAETLSAIYKPFMCPQVPAALPADSCIEISATNYSSSRMVRHRQNVSQCETIAQLLYTIDKALTVELQIRRPDLFFVHAAAVAAADQAIMLVGEPGAGKSTLCWSLCDAGFVYLSDELAPVILGETRVEPFARAISIKRLADCSPALPADTIDVRATMHIPVHSLRGGYATTPLPIGAMVFLLPGSIAKTAGMSELSASEAAARLYANGLNQLAHRHDGLGAAAKIAATVSAFSLPRAELPRMIEAVTELAEQARLGITSRV